MEAKEWKKTLLTEKKNGYDRMPAQEREAMDRYCEGYKAFLDAGKTVLLLALHGLAAHQDVQLLAGDALGQGLLALLRAQVGQQVGHRPGPQHDRRLRPR